jgi:hypothetical protein
MFKYLTHNGKYVNLLYLASYGIEYIDRPILIKDSEDFYKYWMNNTSLWIQPEHVSLFYKNLEKCKINKIELC